MMWRSLRRFPVEVFSYCITCNHAHWVVRSEHNEAISEWMQQVEGEFAQFYNRRKGRTGAFWEGRYHCTMIEPGEHLWRCMVYVELNMVRAGVVKHPADWPWCSYSEWMNRRQRYRLINSTAFLELIGSVDLGSFQQNYKVQIDEAILGDRCRRQPEWTESIAVGSAKFVDEIRGETDWRRRLQTQELPGDAWALKDELALNSIIGTGNQF